jgi:predicted 2-oxoglutarate/Fe(II)-dependent dioxygenase YbiX
MFDQFSYREADMYNKEECQNIIDRYDTLATYRMQQGKNGSNNNNRDVYIENVDLSNHIEIANMLFEANEHFYNFDISRKIECYFARYETGNHYNAEHTDCIILEDNNTLQRKLSFSLLLNQDYTGGDLSITNSTINNTTGNLVVFPSFLPHSVSTVTSGTRYVIFGFCLGPSWR